MHFSLPQKDSRLGFGAHSESELFQSRNGPQSLPPEQK